MEMVVDTPIEVIIKKRISVRTFSALPIKGSKRKRYEK